APQMTGIHGFARFQPATHVPPAPQSQGHRHQTPPTEATRLQEEVDRILLGQYTPAGVVINEDFDILQFRGRTGPYLEPAPGKAPLNLLQMARQELQWEISSTVRLARRKGGPVRKDDIAVRPNGKTLHVDVLVMPLKAPGTGERLYLVLFEPSKMAADTGDTA